MKQQLENNDTHVQENVINIKSDLQNVICVTNDPK